MNSTPRGEGQSRKQSIENAKFPEVDGGLDLIDHLKSLGFCSNSGMGLVGVSWSEVYAWMNLTGVKLTSWEVETLIELSSTYANWANRSVEPSCRPPYDIENRQARSKRIQDKIFSR